MSLEQRLVDAVASVGPWLAPLPTAYLVGHYAVTRLDWWLPVAAAAGLAVESLGVSAVATYLLLRGHNRAKRKTDPAAPEGAALVAVAAYFLSAVALTVLLDTLPSAAVYAPIAFPVLSLAGMLVLALRADQARRVAEAEAERAQRRAERQAKQAEQKVELPAPPAPQPPPGGTRGRAAELLRAQPGITGSALGESLGVSASMGRRYIRELGGNGHA